jgi:exonuclease III
MRIVSWNLGYAYNFKPTHERAWHYLSALDPDIALLQEVHPPRWAHDRWHLLMRPTRWWGSAIAAKPSLTFAPLSDPSRTQDERGGYFATATMTLADGAEVVVASVHTPVGVVSAADYPGMEPDVMRRPGSRTASHNDAAYTIYRALVAGRRFLISGDWNVARLWDRTHRGANEAAFFARASADGWVECYARFHPEGEGRTWFRGDDPPYQNDHAFCDPVTAERLEGCEIYAHPAETLRLSDHAPLIIDIDL